MVQHPFNHCSLRPLTYFLDTPGVQEKTNIRAIQSVLRIRKHKVNAITNSAVAASLLEDGRTARSAFTIPIPSQEDTACNIPLDSKLAYQLCRASLIIRDEIAMC